MLVLSAAQNEQLMREVPLERRTGLSYRVALSYDMDDVLPRQLFNSLIAILNGAEKYSEVTYSVQHELTKLRTGLDTIQNSMVSNIPNRLKRDALLLGMIDWVPQWLYDVDASVVDEAGCQAQITMLQNRIPLFLIKCISNVQNFMVLVDEIMSARLRAQTDRELSYHGSSAIVFNRCHSPALPVQSVLSEQRHELGDLLRESDAELATSGDILRWLDGTMPDPYQRNGL